MLELGGGGGGRGKVRYLYIIFSWLNHLPLHVLHFLFVVFFSKVF